MLSDVMEDYLKAIYILQDETGPLETTSEIADHLILDHYDATVERPDIADLPTRGRDHVGYDALWHEHSSERAASVRDGSASSRLTESWPRVLIRYDPSRSPRRESSYQNSGGNFS